MAEIWGAVLAVGGAVAGAAISSRGAKDAAKEQTKGGDASIAETRRQYDQTREDFAPARETGSQALAAIAHGLGLSGYSKPGTAQPLSFDEWQAQQPAVAQPGVVQTIAGRVTGGRLENPNKKPDPRAAYEQYVQGFQPTGAENPNAVPAGDFNRDFTIADFQKDPGYQFRMDEGSHALEGSAAARTGIQNGRTLKELERYGQDYASGEYSNAYSRFNNDRTTRFNRLASIAGVGQTATGATATAGANASNNVADTIIGQANARAAGRVGEANAVNNGIQTLGNYYLNQRFGSPSSAPKTPPYVYNESNAGGWT